MNSTFPIKCFTCGKEIGGDYEKYHKNVYSKNKSPDSVLDHMKYRRVCCRRMFKTHAHELGEELFLYDHTKRVSEPYLYIDE